MYWTPTKGIVLVDAATTVTQSKIAINHPIGHTTEALLQWWYQRPLEDGQGLPEDLRDIVTDLCDTTASELPHGRVWLAVHVIPLFRVDPRVDWPLSPPIV